MFTFLTAFYILIVGYPQDIDTPQLTMLSLLNVFLDTTDQDLVMFLRDMIYGQDLPGEMGFRVEGKKSGKYAEQTMSDLKTKKQHVAPRRNAGVLCFVSKPQI